jgi:drug/metabolite transporter (DMT)-like permease
VKPVRTYAALVVVQVLFGAWAIAAKLILPHMPALSLAAFRTIAAALVLAVILPWFARPMPWAEHPWRLVGLALLGVVVNQGLFIVGLNMTTPLHATLLITTIPVFTYALAVALGHESLGPRRTLGIALAFLGVLYLVGVGRFEGGARQAMGDLLVAANSLSFAAFLVLSKPMTQRYGALPVTTNVFAIGAVLFVPVGMAMGTVGHVQAAPNWLLALLAFVVLGPTVTTYVLNATALARVPASTVAVFIYLQPVVTAVLAWQILDAPPSWRVLPAAAMVFAGVWLVARRRPKVLRGVTATE